MLRIWNNFCLIFNTMFAWRELVRIGRGKMGGFEDKTNRDMSPKPPFRIYQRATLNCTECVVLSVSCFANPPKIPLVPH